MTLLIWWLVVLALSIGLVGLMAWADEVRDRRERAEDRLGVWTDEEEW